MEIPVFLSSLKSLSWYNNQISHIERIPPREPQIGQLNQPFIPTIQSMLQDHGLKYLYTHQAEAINALRRGENVIVATPAASGKSLCYNLPVLESILEDKSARALYIFPTKALTQDQLKGLMSLSPSEKAVKASVFDGDTPKEDRAYIRRSAQVVMSNPDMLHIGILPNHRSWYRFLRGLRYVVLDEAHVYRGVFGSHVANVLRRLRRLCERYGSSPQFVLASATIANPKQHAENLTGLPFFAVTEDGAPSGGKDFLFWNPPMISPEKGTRHSSNSEASLLMAELLKNEIRTLTFVRSRRLAELIFTYVRDQLRQSNPELAARIAAYRATYLPEDRRRLEHDFLQGKLIGMVSTNALELGINIGDLDATILTGYPGSRASVWQQAGRSGRRGEASLSVLVAVNNPLDQYLMNHPEEFFGKSHESARIYSENPYVLKPHLLSAAYEMPLTARDKTLFGDSFYKYMNDLSSEGLLHFQSDKWHLTPDVEYPAQEFNIRSASSDYYTLLEKDSGAVLETMEESSAFFQLHPGAVYLHQGDSYLVTELDIQSHTAEAVKTDVPYYTVTRDFTDTRVVNIIKKKECRNTTIYFGNVTVSTSVVGFKRKAHFTEEVLGEEYISLPPQLFDTVALWFDIPEETLKHIVSNRMDMAGGLHACEHAAISVLPLFALCDRNDIGGLSTPLHPDTGKPQIFIHDGHPGGVGIAEHGYDIAEQLWKATLDVISNCPCESGCPSCIQSPKCGNNNEPLDKEVARLILKDILD